MNKEVTGKRQCQHHSSLAGFWGGGVTGAPAADPPAEKKPFSSTMCLFMGSESFTTKVGLGHDRTWCPGSSNGDRHTGRVRGQGHGSMGVAGPWFPCTTRAEAGTLLPLAHPACILSPPSTLFIFLPRDLHPTASKYLDSLPPGRTGVKYVDSIVTTEIHEFQFLEVVPSFALSEGLINLFMLFQYSLMICFTMICF